MTWLLYTSRSHDMVALYLYRSHDMVALYNYRSHDMVALYLYRSHDKHSTGYVCKGVFLSVLHSLLEADSEDINEAAHSLCEDTAWVPYPKFLAMFEHGPTLPSPAPSNVHTDPTPSSHSDHVSNRCCIRELTLT